MKVQANNLQVERQLGGVKLWYRCLCWSPSPGAGLGSSCAPDGHRMGPLRGFPAFCASLCPRVIFCSWFL